MLVSKREDARAGARAGRPDRSPCRPFHPKYHRHCVRPPSWWAELDWLMPAGDTEHQLLPGSAIYPLVVLSCCNCREVNATVVGWDCALLSLTGRRAIGRQWIDNKSSRHVHIARCVHVESRLTSSWINCYVDAIRTSNIGRLSLDYRVAWSDYVIGDDGGLRAKTVQTHDFSPQRRNWKRVCRV